MTVHQNQWREIERERVWPYINMGIALYYIDIAYQLNVNEIKEKPSHSTLKRT